MTKETLRELIEVEYERAETISQFKSQVHRLIDLYDKDNNNKPFIPTPGFYTQENLIPFADKCPCNPKNGGSGICGCTMGNQLVPRI